MPQTTNYQPVVAQQTWKGYILPHYKESAKAQSENEERIDFRVEISYTTSKDGISIPKQATVVLQEFEEDQEPDAGKELFKRSWETEFPTVVKKEDINSMIVVAYAQFAGIDHSQIGKGIYGTLSNLSWEGIYLTNKEKEHISFGLVCVNLAGAWLFGITVTDENTDKILGHIDGFAKTEDVIRQEWVINKAREALNNPNEDNQGNLQRLFDLR